MKKTVEFFFFLNNKKKESVETIEKPIKSVLDNKRFLLSPFIKTMSI